MRNVFYAPWCGANKELWHVCRIVGSGFSGMTSKILVVMFATLSCVLMKNKR